VQLVREEMGEVGCTGESLDGGGGVEGEGGVEVVVRWAGVCCCSTVFILLSIRVERRVPMLDGSSVRRVFICLVSTDILDSVL
jgi:hypothetical protein